MRRLGVQTRFMTAIFFGGVLVAGAAGQSQPDSQAGAQLGEQSALGGKQGQGANTEKTSEKPSWATTFAAGTVIPAELANSLDSKKVKQGDAVTARTSDTLKSTDGRTILPQGTKIMGHVTQASARSAGQSDSSLGLAFDKAVLKSGQEITFTAAIQAVGAPVSRTPDSGQVPEADPMGGSVDPGRGTAGSRNAAPGNAGGTTTAPNTTASSNPTTGGVDATGDPRNGGIGNMPGGSSGAGGAGQWNANSRGVVGLHNLNLNAAGDNDGKGAVITSTGKNVHLDGGTRLLLVTQEPSAK